MIKFNSRVDNQYKVFSNFFGGFYFLGQYYKCPEIFYQSRKTLKIEERLCILNAKTGKEAKKLGKNITLRKDWNKIKVNVMHQALLAKFHQNIDLKELLLSTENEELVEYAPWDKNKSYWGWPEKNITGKILMNIRKNIHNTISVVIGGSRSITSKLFVFMILDYYNNLFHNLI